MFLGLLHDCFVGILSPYSSNETVFLLDSNDLLVVHHHLLFSFHPHSDGSPAVFRLPLVKNLFHQQIVSKVFVRCISELEPSVIPASGYLGNGTQELRISLERSNELELLGWP